MKKAETKKIRGLESRRAAKAPRTALFANLCGIWYDQIKSGEKTVEYRDASPYWCNLIGVPPSKAIREITFARGYTKIRMTYEVVKIKLNRRYGQYEIYLGKPIKRKESK